MKGSADTTTFVYVNYIATTPEKLWAALTSSEFTEKYWFGFRIESDWKAGARIAIHPPAGMHEATKGGVVGEVLEYDPPRRLAYTFKSAGQDPTPRVRPSRVRFELNPMGPVVQLVTTHEDL